MEIVVLVFLIDNVTKSTFSVFFFSFFNHFLNEMIRSKKFEFFDSSCNQFTNFLKELCQFSVTSYLYWPYQFPFSLSITGYYC